MKKNNKTGTRSSRSKKTTKTVPKVEKKKGRPTLYSAKLAEKICSRIASGESLLKICRDDDMPDRATIHLWLLKMNEDGTKTYQTFIDNYAIATELRADVAFDEINEIADETPDMIKKTAEKKSSAMAQAQRLRVDSRKWTAARMFPKKYSERHVVTTEDKDGNTVPISGNAITFVNSDGSSKSA
jgi:hypothetical protein